MQKNENSAINGLFSLKKSAYQAENRSLWKITKNIITHQQIVRFGSFLVMLVLTTSGIGFGAKILIFSFLSKKNQRFSANIGQHWLFLAKIRRFFTENKAWYADFPVKIIHISLNFLFSAFFAMNLCFGPIYSLLWPFFGWISAIFGSFLHRALNMKSAIFWTYLGPLEWL